MSVTAWEIMRNALDREAVRVLMCDDDAQQLAMLEAQIRRVFAKLGRQVQISSAERPSLLSREDLAGWDMVFLDIDFPEGEETGIQLARRLREHNKGAVLFFVTNFIEYAPEGYEVQAFRYILKRDIGQIMERYILQAMEQLAEDQEFIRLRSRDTASDIPLSEIRYIEVMDHSVSIHTGSRSISITATLSSLEAGLDGRGFLRSHKSYLVNMRHIRRFRSRECLLTNGRALAVSEKNYSQQKEKYLRWKGLQ